MYARHALQSTRKRLLSPCPRIISSCANGGDEVVLGRRTTTVVRCDNVPLTHQNGRRLHSSATRLSQHDDYWRRTGRRHYSTSPPLSQHPQSFFSILREDDDSTIGDDDDDNLVIDEESASLLSNPSETFALNKAEPFVVEDSSFLTSVESGVLEQVQTVLDYFDEQEMGKIRWRYDQKLQHTSMTCDSQALAAALALYRVLGRNDWEHYDYPTASLSSPPQEEQQEKAKAIVGGEDPLADATSTKSSDASAEGSSDHGIELNEIMQQRSSVEREEEHAAILSMLKHHRQTDTTTLKTADDYNLLLAHVATSCDPSHCTELLFPIAMEYIKEQGYDDANTYELLLLASCRRAKSSREAMRLIERHLCKEPILWTPTSLSVMFHCCSEKKAMEVADCMFDLILEEDFDFAIPSPVYRYYLKLLLNSARHDRALEVLQYLFQNDQDWHLSDPNRIICMIVQKWPWTGDKRASDVYDNVSFLKQLLGLMSNHSNYLPTYEALRLFILAAHKRVGGIGKTVYLKNRALLGGDNRNVDIDTEEERRRSKMSLIPGLFRWLEHFHGHYVPDPRLILAGLEASEQFSDAKLAASLICRLFPQASNSHGYEPGHDSYGGGYPAKDKPDFDLGDAPNHESRYQSPPSNDRAAFDFDRKGSEVQSLNRAAMNSDERPVFDFGSTTEAPTSSARPEIDFDSNTSTTNAFWQLDSEEDLVRPSSDGKPVFDFDNLAPVNQQPSGDRPMFDFGDGSVADPRSNKDRPVFDFFLDAPSGQQSNSERHMFDSTGPDTQQHQVPFNREEPTFDPDVGTAHLNMETDPKSNEDRLVFDFFMDAPSGQQPNSERQLLFDSIGPETPAHLNTETAFEIQLSESLSYSNIARAMDLCVATGNVPAALSILERVLEVEDSIHLKITRMVQRSTLRTCASQAKGIAAERVLSSMIKGGMKPSDEDLSAVVHAFRNEPSADKAAAVMERFELEDQIPGMHCYNTLFSIYVQKELYSDAIYIYEQMKVREYKLYPATMVGAVLSSFQMGGIREAKSMLRELLRNQDLEVRRELCLLALRLVLSSKRALDDSDEENEENEGLVQRIRVQLRQRADLESTSPEEKEWLISLVRLLRLADLEDGRVPSSALSAEEIALKQSKAWGAVIDLVLSEPKSD